MNQAIDDLDSIFMLFYTLSLSNFFFFLSKKKDFWNLTGNLWSFLAEAMIYIWIIIYLWNYVS